MGYQFTQPTQTHVRSYLNDVATNGQGLSRVLRIVAEPAVRRGVEHADSDIDVGTDSKPFNDVATQPLGGAHGLAKLRAVSNAEAELHKSTA